MNYLEGWNYCPVCGHKLESQTIEDDEMQACASDECWFIHYNNPVPTSVALIPYQGGIVMVQRSVEPFIGSWCLPGGYLRKGEKPTQAAVRETREETGLDIRVLHIVDQITTPDNHQVDFYLAEVIGGQLQAADDASEAKVFGPNDLPEYFPFPNQRRLVRDYFSGRLGCPCGTAIVPPKVNASTEPHCQPSQRKEDCDLSVATVAFTLALMTFFTVLLHVFMR